MEIIVPLGRKSSLIVRNAFESLAELEIARTKWTNRELCTSYMRQFIATVNADRTYYGVVINKNNLSVCAVNGAGKCIVSKQFYPRGHVGQRIDFEGSIPRMAEFVRGTIESTSSCANRHIFTLDYDIPVKSVREDILAVIDSACGIGAIKGELYNLDPHFEMVKLRQVMKHMKIDKRLRDPDAAILEFGKSIWSHQFSREKINSLASGDMEEAICYMLCRYAFTHTTQLEFERAMEGEMANPAKDFKRAYSQTFIGRHVKSLGKKYDVIDLKQLPDEVHSDIKKRMSEMIFDALCEIQEL